MTKDLITDSKLLRIFIGEEDKIGHQPLYEALVYEAKRTGMSGASVLRGILSFGESSRIHTTKLLELSSDMPIIVEIVDQEDKIDMFIRIVGDLIDKAACGALVTVEKAEVIHFTSSITRSTDKKGTE